MAPKVKICGLTRPDAARTCRELGVDFCGFIFHPPSPRDILPEAAAALDTGKALRVGIFVKQTAPEVRRIMDAANLDLAQLMGDQDHDFCAEIGFERVIRVFWPERYQDMGILQAEMARFADSAAYFLLDAGTSGGGSGRSLNFERLKALDIPKPWFLAGGLGPRNLGQALEVLSPFAVDLNSALESEPGVKSPALIEQALRIVRNL